MESGIDSDRRRLLQRMLLSPWLRLSAPVALVYGGALRAQGSRSERAAPGSTITVGTLGDELAYDVVEIRARAGSEITIDFVNYSGGMPHNIVFVNADADINPVGLAALEASKTDYIPQDELERIFGYTAMAGPGETVSVTLRVPDERGSYPYICTYPGHFTVMQGRLIAL
ncbi:MAG: plastocyanin/azurin family copper-binding protein [Gammaproteobacteria bacterium]|nr:plastocyanin/azurin family copper-binding protein [Gammaproteobacteria bacterium]